MALRKDYDILLRRVQFLHYDSSSDEDDWSSGWDDDDSMSLSLVDSLDDSDSDFSLGSNDSFDSVDSSSTADVATLFLSAAHASTFSNIEDDTITFGRRPLVEDFNDAQCLHNFRFRKAELFQLVDLLYPRMEAHLSFSSDGQVICNNRYKTPFQTCLLVYLNRLSYPHRLSPEMERLFGMRRSHLSQSINTFSDCLCRVARPYLTNLSIFKHRFSLYAGLIEQKLGIPEASNIWGFLDATIRRTCLVFNSSRYCFYFSIELFSFVSCLFQLLLFTTISLGELQTSSSVARDGVSIPFLGALRFPSALLDAPSSCPGESSPATRLVSPSLRTCVFAPTRVFLLYEEHLLESRARSSS